MSVHISGEKNVVVDILSRHQKRGNSDKTRIGRTLPFIYAELAMLEHHKTLKNMEASLYAQM